MRTYVPYSIVLCIGVIGEKNELNDFKFELGSKYYLKDDKEAQQSINGLAKKLEIDSTPYEKILDIFSKGNFTKGNMLYHEIIGIGLDPKNGPRINIYLQPNYSILQKSM